MLEILNHLFGAVCGQNPEHTWAPGGILLPCCQRCTGLYVGAAVAVFLLAWLKPRLTGRFLEIHGAFLLFMVPCGLYWLPQGPVSRTVSGVLFAFGVVAFLWLPLAAGTTSPTQFLPEPRVARRAWVYGAILAATILLVPLLARFGGAWAAFGLSLLALGGLAALAGLVAANVLLAARGLLRFVRRLVLTRTRA
jgi:hypothetical protein